MLRRRPTPATVISLVALFVALGGTTYAAATIGSAQIKNNSIRSKDIRKGAVASSDIKTGGVRSGDVKNGSLRAGDFAAGQLPAGARGPQGAPGAQGVKGDKGDTGDAGTAVAYAMVVPSGGVIESDSKGLTDANVRRVGDGMYCVSPPAGVNARSAVVSISNISGFADRIATVYQEFPTAQGCNAGEPFRVYTYDTNPEGLDDSQFNIWLED